MNFESRQNGNTSQADWYYNSGLALFEKKKLVEARKQFRQALNLNPKHSGSLKYLGMVLYEDGEYIRAEEMLNQASELLVDDDQLLGCLGLVYLELKQYARAESFQRKVISINPQSVDGYRNLAKVFHRRGLYNEAISTLKKALEIDKDSAETYMMLGEAFNKLDDTDQAITCFETVLRTKHDNPKVFYNLGILYDKKGLRDKASQMYRHSKEITAGKDNYIVSHAPLSGSVDATDMFFSRNLTVVPDEKNLETSEAKDRERDFRKLGRKQSRGKRNPKLPDIDTQLDQPRPGAMDLTKASLKIKEALNLIKTKEKS